MVTRVLELIARPGETDALCRAIEGEVRILLKETKGFLEQVTLVSDGEPRLVILLTVWRSPVAAEQYDQDVSSQMNRMLARYLDSRPHERAFQFAHDGQGAAALSGDDETTQS